MVRRALIALAVVFTVASVVIILRSPYPPMNDASSHIATGYIAMKLAAGDPFFQGWYTFDLTPLPYWSITALLAGLIPLLGPFGSFQALLVLYAVLLPLGFWAVARRASPGSEPLAAIAALTIFNWAYYLGEINFIFGQPLILLGYAAFLGMQRLASWRFVAVLACGVLLYFTHVFALIGFVGAMGMMCVRDVLRRAFRWSIEPLGTARWIAALCTLALFFVAAWFILAAHGTEANKGHLVFDLSAWRLAQLTSHPLRSPTDALHYPSMLMFAAVVLVLLAPHLRTLRVEGLAGLRRVINPAMAWPALGFFLLAWPGPAGIQEEFGFEDIGERFTLMAFLFALGTVRLTADRRWLAVLLVVAGGTGVLKLYDSMQVHARYQDRAQRLSGELIGALPSNAAVLPLLTVDPGAEDMLLHRFGNTAVFLRDAYNPHIFARTGQQPMRHTQRHDFRLLKRPVEPQEWALYDHVLVQGPVPDEVSRRCDEVASAEGFTLLRRRLAPISPEPDPRQSAQIP